MLQEPSISFIAVLILIGAGQALFFSVALFFMRRGDKRANLFLALFGFAGAILLFDGFLNVTNYSSRYPHLIGAIWPFFYLFGPFLYFYVRDLTSPKRVVFSANQFLHFLPAIISALFIIFFYSMSENANVPGLPSLLTPLEEISSPVLKALPQLAVLHKTVYFVLSFLLIRTYSSRIKQSFSSLEKISLSWLGTLLVSFMCALSLYAFIVYFTSHLGVNRENSHIYYLGGVVIGYVLAFKAILQPEIFSRIEAARQAELIRTDQSVVLNALPAVPDMPQKAEDALLYKGKYQKSWLTDERMAEIAHQLLQLMETERPFLEPELTLPQLAERLSASPHHVSQVINRKMNRSFFDLVNEYRVQEAKRLLISPQHDHLSIFGIALDAGFNSKTTFNTAFVKYTGMTPSKFRIQQESARQEAKLHVVSRA